MTILRRSGSRDAARRRVPRVRVLFATTALVGGALIGAGVAAAGPAFNEDTPFAYTADNPCTGEAITGNGLLHTEINDNLSASGTVQSHMNVRLDGLKATAVLSGKRYVVQDTENHEFVIASSGTTEDTYDVTVHFIRQGEDGTFILGDDYYFTWKTHVTANAAGIQSFHMDPPEESCR